MMPRRSTPSGAHKPCRLLGGALHRSRLLTHGRHARSYDDDDFEKVTLPDRTVRYQRMG